MGQGENGAQAEIRRLPEARGDPVPRPWRRDACGDKAILQRVRLDDFEASMKTRAADIAVRFSGPEGQRALIDLLSRQSLFEGNHNVISAVAAEAVVVPVDPDQIIITQGGADTDIYFILVGSLVVTPNGRDDTIRGAGTHVGEMAMIDPAVLRSATVRAGEPSVLAKLSEPQFSAIAQEHPFIWRHLARELAVRLRQRVAKVTKRAEEARVFIASSSES